MDLSSLQHVLYLVSKIWNLCGARFILFITQKYIHNVPLSNFPVVFNGVMPFLVLGIFVYYCVGFL
jgi:hypothetical protein